MKCQQMNSTVYNPPKAYQIQEAILTSNPLLNVSWKLRDIRTQLLINPKIPAIATYNTRSTIISTRCRIPSTPSSYRTYIAHQRPILSSKLPTQAPPSSTTVWFAKLRTCQCGYRGQRAIGKGASVDGGTVRHNSRNRLGCRDSFGGDSESSYCFRGIGSLKISKDKDFTREGLTIMSRVAVKSAVVTVV